jgi:S-layer homology domain
MYISRRSMLRAALCLSGLFAILLVPNAGVAQTPNDTSSDPQLNKALATAPRVVTGSPQGQTILHDIQPQEAFGGGLGATWIAASQFSAKLSNASPDLDYAGNFFFNSAGGSGRYYAQLDVEPGVLISHLTCVYNDANATDNVGFTWYRYTTNVSTGSTTAVALDSFVTSGSPGVGFNFLDPADQTMTTTDAVFALINHYIAVDVTSNVSFAGCWAFWHRQVSPAPGVATFNDVPTGNPFFRHVEALVDSGITSGCGGGNYCPDAPLTRGQMAVFMAQALGLNFGH